MRFIYKYGFIKILLTLPLVFLSIPVFSQANEGFFRLSKPVKLWIITHPFMACKAKKIADRAVLKTKEIKADGRVDGLENGGQVDAFRHAYWMALMAQKYDCRRAYRLGRAYEKGNIRDFRKGNLEEGELPDSVSVAMDMHNNCIGVFIAFDNPGATAEEMAEIVIGKILKGEMLVIKRSKEGVFLDCDGKLIKNEEWHGVWNNKRCLVKSDYKVPEN